MASKWVALERRIQGLERLVVFLAEVLIALIAVVAGGMFAGYLGGDGWLPSSGLAAFAFLVTFLAAGTYIVRYLNGVPMQRVVGKHRGGLSMSLMPKKSSAGSIMLEAFAVIV